MPNTRMSIPSNPAWGRCFVFYLGRTLSVLKNFQTVALAWSPDGKVLAFNKSSNGRQRGWRRNWLRS